MHLRSSDQWLADNPSGGATSTRWVFPIAFSTDLYIFMAYLDGDEDANEPMIRGKSTIGGWASSLSLTGIGKINIYVGFAVGY